MKEIGYHPLAWRVLALSGPDRKPFLHGLVTSDVKGIKPGKDLPSCLLTPKGKLQAHFWAYEDKERLLLVCPDETAGALSAALGKMIMLSESKLADITEKWRVVFTSGRTADGGFPCAALGGYLVLLEPSAKVSGREWTAQEFERRRIEKGVPRFGVDMDGDTIPLEARLDSSISFNKGCYMGQETISRIHHLGHVNKLLVGLRFDSEPPEAPSPVKKDGQTIGTLTSATRLGEGGLGLATVKREDSMPGVVVDCGGRPATVVDLWTPPEPGAA